MTTLPEKVNPGDMVSSDLMNAILAELKLLHGSTEQGGTQVVPNVFGASLADARVQILQPVRQLALGFAIDVSGAAIDPIASANANLIVLNQSPVANSRVAPNTPVNLVVSRVTAGTPTGSPPTITRAETVNGTIATSFPVNGTMVIVGTNFSTSVAQNVVKFDGTTATVTADAADPTRRLFVVVPTGIPGAPVNSGDSPKVGVIVTLQTSIGTPATITVTINSPLSNQPKINNVAPAMQFEKSNITIAGINFTSSAQVFIRDVAATVVSTTPTEIVATVPNFADIPPDSVVQASVIVRISVVPDISDSFKGVFQVIGTSS